MVRYPVLLALSRRRPGVVAQIVSKKVISLRRIAVITRLTGQGYTDGLKALLRKTRQAVDERVRGHQEEQMDRLDLQVLYCNPPCQVLYYSCTCVVCTNIFEALSVVNAKPSLQWLS